MAFETFRKFAKKYKYLLGVVLLIFGILSFQHYSYIYSLSPMMRDFYTNIDNFERVGEWTLNSQRVAEKYFFIGMTKEQALAVMSAQDCQLSVYPYKPKEFEENVACFKKIKGEFFGISLPFFNNYTISVSLDIDNKKIVRVQSAVNIVTIYG